MTLHTLCILHYLKLYLLSDLYFQVHQVDLVLHLHHRHPSVLMIYVSTPFFSLSKLHSGQPVHSTYELLNKYRSLSNSILSTQSLYQASSKAKKLVRQGGLPESVGPTDFMPLIFNLFNS